MSLLDGWRFCPRCGAGATRTDERSICSGCGHTVWAAAIPGVQGLAIAEGRVLLGRRVHEPGRGLWDIPGGFLAESEDAIQGLRREFLEETGLEIEPEEFLGIWVEHYGERFVFAVTWLVRPVGGSATAADDLAELGWFAPDGLPDRAELAFPTHHEILGLWADRASASSA